MLLMFSIEFTAGCLAIITTIIGATVKIVEWTVKIRESIDNFKRMVSMQDKLLLKEVTKQEEKILFLESEINTIKIQLGLCDASDNSKKRHS